MVVRMRHTSGHTGNRRSHHALKVASLSVCKNCGARVQSHVACDVCGNYKGKIVKSKSTPKKSIYK